MQIKIRLLVIAVLATVNCFSQQLFVPRNIQATYKKETRSVDGRPGKNYWQNTADYKINVSFSPDTRLVSGKLDITYVNNSPDTLKQIWFKLYPNLYQKGSPRESKISPEDITDGLIIDSFWINNKSIAVKNLLINATNMTLSRQAVTHGQATHFKISYHYSLNKGSHIRTGEVEPNADFVAYFFPRIAVYDDIDGWNKIPYNGSQEFYNDFCNFDVNITVPKNFVVWATGNLQNCGEVLNPVYCRRIQQAEANDGITTIIDSTDLKQNVTSNERLPPSSRRTIEAAARARRSNSSESGQLTYPI